jgi:hypothetical protein
LKNKKKRGQTYTFFRRDRKEEMKKTTTTGDILSIIHHHTAHKEVEDAVTLLRTRLKPKFDH